MERLTPVELLRFFEEEASTLQLMNSKIANQLHCLQVEEELFNRQLTNLEKGKDPVWAIEYDEQAKDVDDRLDTEDIFQNEIQSGRVEMLSITLVGSTENLPGSSPTVLQSPGTQNSPRGDGQDVNDRLDMEDSLPNQIESEEVEMPSVTLVGSIEQPPGSSPTILQSPGTQTFSGGDGQDVNDRLEMEDNFQNEIQSGQVEMPSITLVGSTELLPGSSPMVLQSPGIGEDPSQIIEPENHMEMGLQGVQQEQDVLPVQETPKPERLKRLVRRPARFQD